MVNVLPVPTAPTAPTAPHCPHQLPGCLVTAHSLHKPSASWAPSLQGPHPRAHWALSLHLECMGGGGHHGDWVHSAHGLTAARGPWAPGAPAPHRPSRPEPPSRSQHRELGTPGLAWGEEGERATCPIARPVELWGGGGLVGAPWEGRRGAAGGKAPSGQVPLWDQRRAASGAGLPIRWSLQSLQGSVPRGQWGGGAPPPRQGRARAPWRRP